MVVTELAVTGLRCIERAEPEIPPGLSRVWGDTGSGKTTLSEAVLAGRGILSFIGDSSGLRQPEQDHLRVIVRRWPFWASRPWASRSAGTHHGACLPALLAVLASAAATTWFRRGGVESGACLGSESLPPVRAV
jgi:hypothetical protein